MPAVRDRNGVGHRLWTPAGVSADSINEKIDRERRRWNSSKTRSKKSDDRQTRRGKSASPFFRAFKRWMSAHVRYRQSHQEISRKLRKKDQEIEAINAQIARLREGVQVRQEAILARLRVQYMEGRFGHWKPLLASDSYGISSAASAICRPFLRATTVSSRPLKRHGHHAGSGAAAGSGACGNAGVQTQHRKASRRDQDSQERKKLYLAKLTQEKESYERAPGIEAIRLAHRQSVS